MYSEAGFCFLLMVPVQGISCIFAVHRNERRGGGGAKMFPPHTHTYGVMAESWQSKEGSRV